MNRITTPLTLAIVLGVGLVALTGTPAQAQRNPQGKSRDAKLFEKTINKWAIIKGYSACQFGDEPEVLQRAQKVIVTNSIAITHFAHPISTATDDSYLGYVKTERGYAIIHLFRFRGEDKW